MREPNGPWRRCPNYVSQAPSWAGRGAASGWCRLWGEEDAGDGGGGGSGAVALPLCASPRAAPERGAPVRKRGCRRPGAARTAPCQGAAASRPSKPPLGSVSLLPLHGDACLYLCVPASVCVCVRVPGSVWVLRVLLRDSVREGVRGCVCRALLCQPALGGSRLPSGHSDGKKVENKWFCLPDLVLKRKGAGLQGCICCKSRLFPFSLELPVPGAPRLLCGLWDRACPDPRARGSEF